MADVLARTRTVCEGLPMQPLIGTAEVARILGKSPRTIHKMVKIGELTPVLTAPGGGAGTYLFDRDEIERLVAA